MNEEILDTLNELSKKPITELAMSYMEVVVDNIVKDKEIARLNKIIDELEQYLKDKLYYYEPSPNLDKAIENYTYSKVLDRLQELKEEGK